MRLLKQDPRRGLLVLLPEDMDDLWALYVAIEPGDLVRARTTREKRVKAGGQKGRRGKRVSAKLGIQVEKKAFDALMKRLRVLGVIKEAPSELEDEVGKHHTLNVRPGTPVEIQKEHWTRYQLEVIKRACSSKPKPLLVLSIDDEDYCVALVGMRDVEALAEGHASPAAGVASKEEALRPFFREALEALRRAWEEQKRPIAIIGPSFERALFLSMLKRECPELEKAVVSTRSVSTGGLSGVYEALRAGVLSKALSEARLAREAEVMRELLARLGKDDGRVAYGLSDVKNACALGAVELLLVSDALLRDADEPLRLELEALMMDVEAKKGGVMIVSSAHEAGRNLVSLGGVAALLRFPITRSPRTPEEAEPGS